MSALSAAPEDVLLPQACRAISYMEMIYRYSMACLLAAKILSLHRLRRWRAYVEETSRSWLRKMNTVSEPVNVFILLFNIFCA